MKLKKSILMAGALAFATTNIAMANEGVEKEGPYVVVKGLAVMGDDVSHGEATLSGKNDFGFGIDLGYKLGNGFALEYDFSYSSNDIIESSEHEESKTFSGKYYTHALDVVYTYEVEEGFGLFGKVGYEWENEKIDELNVDSWDNNFVFGAGVEIAVAENINFVAEYEHSLIDGPRGDGVFAGISYTF